MQVLDAYSWVKDLHVLGAALIIGTAVGTAVQLGRTRSSDDAATVAAATRSASAMNLLVTAPAFVLQPVSGTVLIFMAGWSLSDPWILVSTILYVVAGVAGVLTLVLQSNLGGLATAAAANGPSLPPRYRAMRRGWLCFGWLALAALLAIGHLMVEKPVF